MRFSGKRHELAEVELLSLEGVKNLRLCAVAKDQRPPHFPPTMNFDLQDPTSDLLGVMAGPGGSEDGLNSARPFPGLRQPQASLFWGVVATFGPRALLVARNARLAPADVQR